MPFIIAAVIVVGMLFFRRAIESWAFYFPSRETFVTPEGYEDVSFSTADGVGLHGWFMPAVDVQSAAPTILHVHGNAGNVSGHAGFSEFLTMQGFNVFVFDYRCFGRSDETGTLYRDLLLRDARAARAYLATRDDVREGELGLFGVSLGASIAAALAGEDKQFQAVCLSSGFASWKRIANEKLPGIGWLLVGNGLDIKKSITLFGEQPVLIVHGANDAVIPVQHARDLQTIAEEAGMESELIVVPGGGHNDVPMDYPSVRQSIADFFREHMEN